jgi:hypothetical protein
MTTVVVVDNSMLLPLFFGDEDDLTSRELMLRETSLLQLICPALCVMEFGNGILKGLRLLPNSQPPPLGNLGTCLSSSGSA